ncbi:MAG TPA: histidine triad nucleotide-binding protein [Myxococcales bacterium]|nr:histidine triad nucleotide-binding protein [Myxococcales bacterium]HIN85425.1 histidine triad nucleotide-binding protein [Myxococcales bacterium]
MSDSCLFCKIVLGEIPATFVYQDEFVVAFEDINPAAPTHILVIPRQHISTLNDLEAKHDATVGRMTRVAASIAKERGIAEGGFRTVFNCNEDGGQSVYHIHQHLLGGRSMSWPPG